MSKQIHNGEGDRRQQVKFRAPESLIEEFDAFVDAAEEYDHRAHALRAAMRRMLGEADEADAPRQPPVEEELRTSYLALVALANYAGIVPHEVATVELSTRLGKNQKVIEKTVLTELRKRGYLRQLTNIQGTDRAWKVRGYDEV